MKLWLKIEVKETLTSHKSKEERVSRMRTGSTF